MDYKEFFHTDNKSGWKGIESKLKNKHPRIHEVIILFNDDETKDLPFIRKIWHLINSIKTIPKCKECTNHAKFLRLESGYQEFCCVKCSNKNKNKIQSTKDSLTKTYGVDSSFKIDHVKKIIEEKNIKNYGVDNPFKNKEIQDRIKEGHIKTYGTDSPLKNLEFRQKYISKHSKIEKEVQTKLSGDTFVFNGKEFDIKIDNDIIEVDGDYFHKNKLENLSFIQVNTLINDKIKIDSINDSEYTLYKARVSDIKKLSDINIESLKEIAYQPDYSLGYIQKIIKKEYFKNYIDKKGKEKLINYLPLILKFIRTFQPEFPYPDATEELDNVLPKLNGFDYSNIYNPITKEFRNNVSLIGVNYLKSSFKSYWKSSYRNNKSPIEIWNDDAMMLKVIAYRIGINDSNEVFDLSLRNLINGISAIRGTISFFKPTVAAAIYKHYLGDIENPKVFDPCCGFGGRLLGFKSIYPNGSYTGCEPNVLTYGELKSVGDRFDRVSITNVKLEDYRGDTEYDLCFTSIPYFNTEDYKNNVNYKDFDDWRDKFITPLLKYKRLIINMSYELAVRLNLTGNIDTYLVNNVSHLNKNKKQKREVIIKLNF